MYSIQFKSPNSDTWRHICYGGTNVPILYVNEKAAEKDLDFLFPRKLGYTKDESRVSKYSYRREKDV